MTATPNFELKSPLCLTQSDQGSSRQMIVFSRDVYKPRPKPLEKIIINVDDPGNDEVVVDESLPTNFGHVWSVRLPLPQECKALGDALLVDCASQSS